MSTSTQPTLFETATDQDVRAWAAVHGFDCPRTGRVPDSLREAHAAWTERPHNVVTHLLLPSMGLACGVDMLDCPCCQVQWRGRPSCPWCRSLGPAWFRWACRIMQGLDPITGERRNTEDELRRLAGVAA